MAISFIGVSTAWTSNATSTSFTINRPAGTLADGDLMIAVLGWSTGSIHTDLSVTVPSGWTKQDEVFNQGDGWDSQLCVMTRFYVAGDPASWSGTLSASTAKIKVSGVCAYRGVQSLLVKGTSSSAFPATSYATATVNNTVANSWRFTTAAYESATLDYNLNINETTSRALYGGTSAVDSDNVQVRISDSNGAIATGNTSRTVSRSAAWDASTSWIGILRETAGTPATGTASLTLSHPAVASAGEVHDDATMAVSLGGVSMSGAGFGQPPDITSDLAVQLQPVGVEFAAALPVDGSLAMAVLPSIQFYGETRVFGIRVITVEFDESRRIIVPSRGVDD